MRELGRRGYRVYHEPGRQIVKEQLSSGGDGVPWRSAEKFAMLVLSRAIHQVDDAASHDDISFFDRSIIDVLNHFRQHDLPVPPDLSRAVEIYRYNPHVFLSPPWPEIYETDNERRHSFEDAVGEYERLLRTYSDLGYKVVIVPKLPISERADFVIGRLVI